MINILLNLYSSFFSKKQFVKFNKFLFLISIRGLGLLNYKNYKISGELYLINKVLKQVDIKVIFDVGANVGKYTKIVANQFPNAKVFSFEPHPKTFEKLRENTIDSDNFTNLNVFNLGFSNETKQAIIYDYEVNDGSSHASIYREVISEIHHNRNVSEHKIQLSTIDEFCTKNKIETIDFLKIDTEGNEYAVLKGAEDMLKNSKIKMIQFEFNEMNTISTTFFKVFYETLENYDIYRLLQNGLLQISNYSPLYCELFAYQNIVAIEKGLSRTIKNI